MKIIFSVAPTPFAVFSFLSRGSTLSLRNQGKDYPKEPIPVNDNFEHKTHKIVTHSPSSIAMPYWLKTMDSEYGTRPVGGWHYLKKCLYGQRKRRSNKIGKYATNVKIDMYAYFLVGTYPKGNDYADSSFNKE